jgi:hypothetical protein
VSEAVSVSVAVREQLSVDARACTFPLSNVGLFDSLRYIVSDSAVSDGRSQSTLERQLCNPVLELQSVRSETDRFYLNLIDLSSRSMYVVDGILAESLSSIESEEDLLVGHL